MAAQKFSKNYFYMALMVMQYYKRPLLTRKCGIEAVWLSCWLGGLPLTVLSVIQV